MRKSNKVKLMTSEKIVLLEPGDIRLYHKCEPLFNLVQDLALEVIELKQTVNTLIKQLNERLP